MALLRLSLVLLPVLFGCSVDLDYVLHASYEDFNAEEFEVLVRETEHLCERTEGQDCLVVTREHSSSSVHRVADLGSGIDGECAISRRHGSIRIRISESGMKHLASVFRHELGHAAGCDKHLPAGNTMSKYRGQMSDDWTKADLECVGYQKESE